MDDLIPKSVAEQHFIGKCEAEAKAARYKQMAEDSIPKELVKAIAEQIGKDLVSYIEVMYPQAIKATSSTFKTSMKNHVYNDIMAIAELHDEVSLRERLAFREKHRREWLAQWRKIRRKK